METQKAQLANRGASNLAVKSIEDFTSLCEAEYKVRYGSIVEEFKGRKDQLVRIKDNKIQEYKFIFQMIDLNTQMNAGKPNPIAIMEMEKAISQLTVSETMNSNTIQYWQKEFGDAFIIPVLCDLLNYFLRQFTVKESLDGNQIMQLACRLISVQPTLRIKELVSCLNNALNGKYGPTYQRIGMENIMEWLSKFFEQSSIDLEQKQINGKPDESRGERPWELLDRKMDQYRNEQEKKKQISERVWGIEKRQKEIADYKESLKDKPHE